MRLAGLNTASGLAVANADNVVRAVRTSGDRILAGGDFAQVATLPRQGIACLVPAQLVDVPPPLPVSRLAFAGAIPNPVAGRAALSFSLPTVTQVRISVHDLLGRLIDRPVDGILPAGRHEIPWDPSARGARAGVCFIRLEALGQSLTRRVLVLR